jgi:hypothetical protein
LCIRQEAYLCKPHGLFSLYIDRPTLLQDAHARLDRPDFAAYGWPEGISDVDIPKDMLVLILEGFRTCLAAHGDNQTISDAMTTIAR